MESDSDDDYEELRSAQEVLDDMILLSMMNDLKGTLWKQSPNDIYRVLRKYSNWRFKGPWKPRRIKILAKVFLKYGHLLVAQPLPFASLQNTLIFKSALMFISQDFPEIAELVLYSPLMKELDKHIDSWSNYKPTITEVEWLLCLIHMKQRHEVIASHHWWDVVDKIDTVNGEPFKLAEEKYRQECRGERELHIMNCFDPKKMSMPVRAYPPSITEAQIANFDRLKHLLGNAKRARADLIKAMTKAYRTGIKEEIRNTEEPNDTIQEILAQAQSSATTAEHEFDMFAWKTQVVPFAS